MSSPQPELHVLLLAWQGARAGIERHVATLVQTLPRRFRTAVAFLSRGGPIADELTADGVPVHVLGMRRSYDPLGSLRLLRLVHAERIDLIHDHSTMAALPALTLGLARVPLVVTEHLAFAQRRLDQRLSYRLLSRFVDCFIANSTATRADLIAHGMRAQKVRVIHPGLRAMETVTSDQAREALKAVLAARGPAIDLRNRLLVGFVGRLEPEKGCRHFVALSARVAAAVPDARFVIVGEGSQRLAVVADIEAAGLRDRVVMTGSVNEIERMYPAFDVLVSTSERETFGLAILEAMAAGVAVAAFRVGGVGELIEAGVGESVPPGDVVALADRVVALLRDAARRQALGTRARQRVAERFSAAHMAEEVARVYDAVYTARAKS
jgi:glycosyltransferase involved in cell wall biosynthesis